MGDDSLLPIDATEQRLVDGESPDDNVTAVAAATSNASNVDGAAAAAPETQAPPSGNDEVRAS